MDSKEADRKTMLKVRVRCAVLVSGTYLVETDGEGVLVTNEVFPTAMGPAWAEGVGNGVTVELANGVKPFVLAQLLSDMAEKARRDAEQHGKGMGEVASPDGAKA